MVTIRSSNEIILSLLDFFKLAQPDLDVKPGEVARDLFIDAPASAIATLYSELSSVSSQQSLRLVVGSDLDKLGKNFGKSRIQATPATGLALLTFSDINSNININTGSIVISNNGFSYAIQSGVSITAASANFYKSIASKFKDQLELAGITDQYAVEVTVVALTPGTAGNIGTYSLNRTTIPGVSNVTNVYSFSGGTDQEKDAVFKNRILSSFSGASVGTSLGYLNIALGTPGVADVYVVQPGDSLMVRDGSVVQVNADNTRTILSEGSGGKVDVVVLGSNLMENTETFIYRDKSNSNDPTSTKNNIILGQIASDVNKTIVRKRIDNIRSGILPIQPINNILEVTGSSSGNNFAPKSIDSFGRVSGNYELVKDTGAYAGSPWGFDTFKWISNKISMFSEDQVKGQFNGQDNVTFTDVQSIPKIQQNINIINENSIVTSDRSIIQLLHTPLTNVTRVFNVNTGERYAIVDQNVDKTGSFNTTGRVKILGNTLPSQSNVLQVDYNWIVNYDAHSDYDGLSNTSNIRSVIDSIDWGYAGNIKNEYITFTKDITENFFVGAASHPISTIASALKYLEIDGVVTRVTSGVFINRLAIRLSNLIDPATIIDSIVLKNTNVELYKTAEDNGSFTNMSVIVGVDLLNEVTIILPTDSVAQVNDYVSVTMNSTNVFYSELLSGSISGSQITIPSELIDTVANTLVLKVNYIANVLELFSAATTQLPASRSGNGYLLRNNNGFNNFSIVNASRREAQIIKQNTNNQIYVDLTLSSLEFNLLPSQVLSVIRLSDYKELWNSNNLGTIIVGTNNNYQLVLNGINTPVVGERVLIIYYATDAQRFQPFSYENIIIKNKISTLSSVNNKLTVLLNEFVTEILPITFIVYEPNTDIALFAVTDGYLTSLNNGTAVLSCTTDFSALPNLTNKKIKVISDYNNGYYDIIDYNSSNNNIIITNILHNITNDNIMIVKLSDGKEIWDYNGVIDHVNNHLIISNSNANAGDSVYVQYFKFKSLRQAPTKIISNTSDQVLNTGAINISGTTLFKAEDIIFTATNTGLRLNLNEAIRKALTLSSSASIPTNIKIAKIIKAEKVRTVSANNDNVLQILATYDVQNSIIKHNLLYSDSMLQNSNLQNLEFVLPNTVNNSLTIPTNNIPTIGDKIRITFYYMIENDSETISYTRNGTLYTNKLFAFINKFYIASGFKASQSTKFTASSFTQPALGSRYTIFYDYLAPKQNERVLIRYNYNKLISDVTFNLESSRAINADVIVRQAKQILVDLTMNIVILDEYRTSQNTVLQNVRDKLLEALSIDSLGETIDAITLINIAQGVGGVARARILYFNKNGNTGQVLKIKAQNDEYFAPNNIIINTETR
jgi:hypothetical protein